MTTNRKQPMKAESPDIELSEADFVDFVARGATELTPNHVHRLIAAIPDVREQFDRLRISPHPEAASQLAFLCEVVESVWTGTYLEMSYAAALEAAFAVAYFSSETDLIPDRLGTIGLIDDALVVQTVFARHAAEFAAFAAFRDTLKRRANASA